jgi:hypothetical protein
MGYSMGYSIGYSMGYLRCPRGATQGVLKYPLGGVLEGDSGTVGTSSVRRPSLSPRSRSTSICTVNTRVPREYPESTP